MRAPTRNPRDLWQGANFFVSHKTCALDDDKFCILTLPFFFPLESACEQNGKEKYRNEHKRNARFEIK